jgi:hypothetical protein
MNELPEFQDKFARSFIYQRMIRNSSTSRCNHINRDDNPGEARPTLLLMCQSRTETLSRRVIKVSSLAGDGDQMQDVLNDRLGREYQHTIEQVKHAWQFGIPCLMSLGY